MKLVEYNNIEEKEEFFHQGATKINFNIEGIFKEIRKFTKEGDSFIYRGCSEAKYKMYNSAQRLYMNQDLHLQVPPDQITEHYKKFISELIESCKKWNNRAVEKLLLNAGISKDNSLAFLSYMQHYGVPTPFLDYTYNPYVAMFMAIDNLSYVPSNNEIDNYFSLYYTYANSSAFAGWKDVFDNNIKQKDIISYEDVDSSNMSIILPEEKLYQIINSINIINQEGLFFYNNHPWYPLERTYKEYTDFLLDKWGKGKFDAFKIEDKVSGCYNIHKSLIPAIKVKLAELGIDKNYIYPDMVNFKNTVTEEGILNSLSLKK